MSTQITLDVIILIAGVWLKFYLHYKTKPKIDDHFFHPRLISGIRTNGHRFLSEHPGIAYEKNFCYPQALHWLLSFLGSRLAIQIALYQTPFFFLASVCLSYALSYWFLPDKAVFFGLSFNLVATLLYLLTPFNYANWNSKNSGISVRALGVFIAQLFLVSILFFYVFETPLYILVAILLSLLAFLSSQFAIQFILFYSVIFSFLKLSIIPILVVTLATIFFISLFPKLSNQFFKGQLVHKYLYFKYLYRKNILVNRRTIYRDIVIDVWLYLKDSPWRNFTYLLYNPLVSVLFLMPFTVLFLFISLSCEMQSEFLLFIAPAPLLFIVFSFKRTRFLGEPERYVEIMYPFVLLISLSYMNCFLRDYEKHLIIFLFIFSLILVIIQYLHSKQFSKPKEYEKSSFSKLLVDTLEPCTEGPIYIASNNTRLIDPLMEIDGYKILKPVLSSKEFAGEPFESIYDVKGNFRNFSIQSLKRIVEYYKFDILVLDIGIINDNEILDDLFESQKYKLNEIARHNQKAIVYEILY